MARVLLAGESWISDVVDHKGYDHFAHTQLHIGCSRLLEVLRDAGHEVHHLLSHDVAQHFPSTRAGLERYDVLILSDIGTNSLLLSPSVFECGQPQPNRLDLIADWVRAGGGLLMAGGYLSFQGFNAMARYAGTPVEDVLPVSIFRYDDRVETPQGVRPQCERPADELVAHMPGDPWPVLLGYQKLVAKPGATVAASIEKDPLLIRWQCGAGRAVAYASDVSPHWAPEEFMQWAGYATLMNNIVRYLAKEDGIDGS